jgi:hypothetical protein
MKTIYTDASQFKNSLTKEQRRAIWQYCIDHSQIQPNGYHGVMFYCRDEEDFWERITARWTGDFIRDNIELKEMFALRKKKKWDKHMQKYARYRTIAENPLVRFLAWVLGW